MEVIQLQDDGPEGSMSNPLTVIGLSSAEVMRLLLTGVVFGVQATGDAIVVCATDDPDGLAKQVQTAVEKRRGPVDVFRVDGGE